MTSSKSPETLEFSDGELILIDQTRLPQELVTLTCRTVEETHDAIQRLVVRGAPAIGIAAAYGVCLAAKSSGASRQDYLDAADHLATSRPTAVNLFWALDRMRATIAATTDETMLHGKLVEEAKKFAKRIVKCARASVAMLLARSKQCVLTHCNAGGLATSMGYA